MVELNFSLIEQYLMLLEVLDPKTAKSVMLLRVITRFYPGFTRETSISILETQFTRTRFLRVVPTRYSTRPDSIKVEEVYQSGELAHGWHQPHYSNKYLLLAT